MEILSRTSLKTQIEFQQEIMPYLLHEKYELFIQNILKDDYLLFYDKVTNALMPARKFKVKFFTMLQPIYPPVTVKGKRLTVNDEKHFLNEFTTYVAASKIASRITQSPTYALFGATPDGSKFCPFGTYLMDLENHTEEELFNKIQSRTRRYIKGMEKINVAIKWGPTTLEDFYALYKDTMARTNMYYEPKIEIQELAEYLTGNHALLGVAYWNGKPQGGLFVAYTLYSAYSLYAGSAEHIENHGTMHYLYWEAMRIMKNKNVKLFDCVGARINKVSGTKQEGIQNFKMKLGVELKEGFLWKKDIDIPSCKLFDILMKTKYVLKGKSPYKDIIDEESEKKIN